MNCPLKPGIECYLVDFLPPNKKHDPCLFCYHDDIIDDMTLIESANQQHRAVTA